MGSNQRIALPRSLQGIVDPPTEAQREAMHKRVRDQVANYQRKEAGKKSTSKRPQRSWTIPEKVDEMAEKFAAQNSPIQQD